MSTLPDFDWRKQAAAAAAPAPGSTPDDQIERAFLDSAFVAVANKAGQLMEPQHRIGFEIVSKNDDNTRLLGVFAFRSGKEMLYGPVFFLNGDIKGTDLIYRHKVKRFLPMNEQIIRRLVSMTKLQDGVGVERSYARRQPQALQLERMAFPPPTYKKASTGADVFDPQAFEAELLRQVPIPDSGLADFIRHRGGSDALNKLASFMERLPVFANACETLLTKQAMGLDGEVALPADVTVESVLRGISKQASEQEKQALRSATYRALVGAKTDNTKMASAFFGESLILHVADNAVFNKEASADRREKSATRGYDLQDTRKNLKPAIVDYTNELRTLEQPGFHKVIDADGNSVTVRAFRMARGSIYDLTVPASGSHCGEPVCSYGQREESLDFFCVTDGEKAKLSQRLNGPDTLISEEDTLKDAYEGLEESPAAGESVWLLVDKSTGEIYTRPFQILSKGETDRGLITYEIRFQYSEDTRTLRVNPDIPNARDGVCGNTVRFVRIDTKPKNSDERCCPGANFGEIENFTVIGRTDLLGEMRKQACQRLTVKSHDHGWFSAATGHGLFGEELPRAKAACALAARLEIPADNAEEILDAAVARGQVGVWFHTDGKQAGAIRVMDEPIFRLDSDTDFNVDLQQPQSFALRTSQYRDVVPPDRIGDHANLQPDRPQNREQSVAEMEHLPEDILLNSSPEEIAGIAGELKIPKIFEVGVVGALASAYQSAAIVASFMPKLEEAMDALGRTLFLYYWKPDDFKKAYGEDDMPSLELELISQFKSLGDLWLKLSQTTPEKDPLASGLPL